MLRRHFIPVKANKPGRKKVAPTWKTHERLTARAFGTNRVPMSGAVSSLRTHSDTFHNHLYIECKYRQGHSVYSDYDRAMRFCAKLREKKKGLASVVKYPAVLVVMPQYRRQVLLIHEKDLGRVYPDDFYTVTVYKQRSSVYSLYLDTVKKAEVEEKIPCLSLKQKRRPGYLLGFFVGHKKEIEQHYGKDH